MIWIDPLSASVALAGVLGAGWIYARSRRELPDRLYVGGVLVAVAGAVGYEVTGGSIALGVMFAGAALAFAVIIADLETGRLGTGN